MKPSTLRVFSLSITLLLSNLVFGEGLEHAGDLHDRTNREQMPNQVFHTTLEIATWNVEHLNEDNEAGCIPRTDEDYANIKARIDALTADVVAIQEVESEVAAYRVFDASEWTVVMSGRPNTRGDSGGSICWGTQDKHLRHQATGVAFRKSVAVSVNPSLSSLSQAGDSQRWGTDITVLVGDMNVRVLSVHLASGCWGPEQDADASREPICTTLKHQIDELSKWIANRTANNDNWILLGDFNRRLALPDDWAAVQLFADELDSVLLTATLRDGVAQKDWCDARYPDLIDHILSSSSLQDKLVPSSIEEHPRIHESPDHCIISAAFNF